MRLMNEHHTFTGMLKDLSRSKHPANFLYDARNIRLSTIDDSTLLAITNEKGSEWLHSINGIYLGHCLINKYLVVFSTDPSTQTKIDYITRVDLSLINQLNISETNFCVILYAGDLKFHLNSKIQAVGYYENDNIQKVYWIDGFNQPRIINITDSRIELRANENDFTPWNDNSFDFIPTLDLNEKVFILKKVGANGMFAPGVILYAFTYYYTNGQESAIFYTSPLMYLSHGDRGAAPDDKVDNVFEITITGIDNKFDYLRIYSIQRTSIDSAPIAKRILDIEIQSLTDNTATFIDNGTVGDSIDPTELLYKSGDTIIPQTIELKDGTLFLGNIEFLRLNVSQIMTRVLELGYWNNAESWLEASYRILNLGLKSSTDYPYKTQLCATERRNSIDCSVPCGGFKTGNYYRLGVQFQDNTGKWSTPVFISDYRILGKEDKNYFNRAYPKHIYENADLIVGDQSLNNNEYIVLNAIKLKIPEGDALKLSEYYNKVRPVVVFPNPMDRVVIHQGVVCPTLYALNYNYRSSWFFRPRLINLTGRNSGDYISPNMDYQSYLYYTDKNIGGSNNELGYDPINIKEVEILGQYENADKFLVVKSFNTFHSPDLVFDDYYVNPSYEGTKYQYVGDVSFKKTFFSIDIQTETPTINKLGSGFIKQEGKLNYSYGLAAGLFYEDFAVDDNTEYESLNNEKLPFRWLVYPWHRKGSLNNDTERPANKGVQSSLLKKKVISNLRIANTDWKYYKLDSNHISLDYYDHNNFSGYPQLFYNDLLSILRFKDNDDSLVYWGNTDLLLTPKYKEGLYFSFNETHFVDDNNDYNASFNDLVWWKTFSLSEDRENSGGLYKFNDSSTIWAKDTHPVYGTQNHQIGDGNLALALQKDPVRIKYKSTPHLVLYTNTDIESDTFIANGATPKSDGSYLPIVEIVRPGDNNNTNGYRSTMFGGKSMDAFKANVWIPCGEPVRLDSFTKINNDYFVVCKYSYGDTYFQRWDCLKTYPFTNEDVNQIVEIGSFMLETYVNIDGRYDRNRGLINNTSTSPVNFNLLNPIYSQIDNFFSYKILDDSFYTLNKYANQIVWSKEKLSGADVDSWTNITLASSYDLDGTKGEITSIVSWKDKLLCFLNSGISQILFNSRVLIPTSDDNPIEISNSYKVDGYRYITEGVGCTDKWLIKGTPTGVYFIDNSSKNLYQLADGLQNISVSHNMASWFNDNTIDRLLYDIVHNDLYITYNESGYTKALYYSETLGQFVSFLDYKDILFLESYNNNTFAGNISSNSIDVNQMFVGISNNLFGEFYDWELTFISNGLDSGAVDMDKIFSTIDYRMDIENSNLQLKNLTFTHIQVDNEYQTTGEVKLAAFNPIVIKNKNLQKKFRTWRILIPRAKKLKDGKLVPTNDRIRNQWCTIKLKCKGYTETSSDKVTTGKAKLHDINVQYFI